MRVVGPIYNRDNAIRRAAGRRRSNIGGIFENIDKAITHEFAMLPQHTTGKIYIDGDVPLMVKACEKVKLHHNISAEVVKCYKNEF